MSVLGGILEAQGDFAGAILAWRKAGDISSLRGVAQRATEAGRLEQAFLAYRAIRDVAPERGVLPLTSFLWDQVADEDAASEVLREALADYPTSAYRGDWLRRLGDYLRYQGRCKEAEALYKQVLEENPRAVWAWLGLGWVYYKGGYGLEPAQDAFLAAISVAPQQWDSYFAMGQMLSEVGDCTEADAWFQRAIERNPHVQWQYVERANSARRAGNLSLVLMVYRETIARFPDYARAYYEMALAYRLNEQPPEAVSAIEKALDLMHNPPQLYYVRAGQIYEWVGDFDKAVEAYRAALALEPQDKAVRAALERLTR